MKQPSDAGRGIERKAGLKRLVCGSLLCGMAAAGAAEKAPYSPYVSPPGAQRVYFGDTHLHTAYSTDAGLIGNRLGPEEAYKFARGHEVMLSSGQPARLDRPLDFLVVSDHAENLGLAEAIRTSNPELLSNETGRAWHDLFKAGKGYEAFVEWVIAAGQRKDLIANERLAQSMWDEISDIADRYDEPGLFTAFIGYEWSSMPQEGNNLHRVLIFRDDGAHTKQVLPFSLYDSEDPERLWAYMAKYEERTGGKVLAIPHNSNLSNGMMFAVEKFDGEPLDKDYAMRRMRWEPVIEVTQIKGDSETHPKLSPNDEFADYARWDDTNLLGRRLKEDWMLQFEYARSALKLGLRLDAELGANPFKFGLVGSTDSHTSVSAIAEENFMGKASLHEPSATRHKTVLIKSPLNDRYTKVGWQEIGSGLAAIWSNDNSRAALFDAIRRKETYATTGSRMTVRFFGGWDYTAADVWRSDMTEIGYTRGVPMGGDLQGYTSKPPSFMVAAMRDPMGANLDRIQIVKGWMDAAGELQEKVFNVAVSDGRQIAADGSVPRVGSTADVATATYSNDIGAAELRVVWTDPEFDPALRSVYYVRVLEIPRPTWVARDEVYYQIQAPDNVTKVAQERAYTSPIWFTPQ